ncbi:MAG: hypothetical protein WDN03_06195 [Rhizomicrobium sp.]
MTEDISARRARLAAALEQQFDRCNALMQRLLWPEMRDVGLAPLAMALTRTCAQLSGMIDRLDRRTEAAAEKPSRNGGSNTQDNCDAV